MKPIIEQPTDTILTKDITEQHIVVAVMSGQPRILSKGYEQSISKLTMLSLKNKFTIGNGVECCGKTLKEIVENLILDKNNKVAVFHQDNWKEALQWLIDNA